MAMGRGGARTPTAERDLVVPAQVDESLPPSNRQSIKQSTSTKPRSKYEAFGGYINPRRRTPRPQKMKWTVAEDRKLLLIGFGREIRAKEHDLVASMFDQQPTSKAIAERLAKLRREQKDVLLSWEMSAPEADLYDENDNVVAPEALPSREESSVEEEGGYDANMQERPVKSAKIILKRMATSKTTVVPGKSSIASDKPGKRTTTAAVATITESRPHSPQQLSKPNTCTKQAEAAATTTMTTAAGPILTSMPTLRPLPSRKRTYGSDADPRTETAIHSVVRGPKSLPAVVDDPVVPVGVPMRGPDGRLYLMQLLPEDERMEDSPAGEKDDGFDV